MLSYGAIAAANTLLCSTTAFVCRSASAGAVSYQSGCWGNMLSMLCQRYGPLRFCAQSQMQSLHNLAEFGPFSWAFAVLKQSLISYTITVYDNCQSYAESFSLKQPTSPPTCFTRLYKMKSLGGTGCSSPSLIASFGNPTLVRARTGAPRQRLLTCSNTANPQSSDLKKPAEFERGLIMPSKLVGTGPSCLVSSIFEGCCLKSNPALAHFQGALLVVQTLLAMLCCYVLCA